MSYSVAVDGPAGAGKSTIAKAVAKKKKFVYVDTGAMYRAMGLYLIQKGVKPEEREAIETQCNEADIRIVYEKGEQIVFLNGENVNTLIRTEEAGKMASSVGTNGTVRAKLVDMQQKMALTADIIMDGRDIGTCVLPRADVKIYLTASSKVRAERRYNELIGKGIPCDIKQIEEDIIERDRQDMTREISPLKQADDAILLDTSDMTIEEAVNAIITLCK